MMHGEDVTFISDEVRERVEKEKQLSDDLIASDIVAFALSYYEGVDIEEIWPLIQDPEYLRGLWASLQIEVKAKSTSPGLPIEVERTATLIIVQPDGMRIPCDLKWDREKDPHGENITLHLPTKAHDSGRGGEDTPSYIETPPAPRQFGLVLIAHCQDRTQGLWDEDRYSVF